MSDIVERLRTTPTKLVRVPLLNDAADEIEALRAVVRYCAEVEGFHDGRLQQDVDLDMDPWHSNAVRRALEVEDTLRNDARAEVDAMVAAGHPVADVAVEMAVEVLRLRRESSGSSGGDDQ